MGKDILYVDNSTLKAVARCSTEATLRYVHDLTSINKSGPLESGHAGHEALETWFKGGTMGQALTTFADEYKTWADENVPPDDRLSFDNVRKILSHWFDTNPVSGMPFKVNPDLIEIGFQFPLTEDIVMVGRMDGLVEDFRTGALNVLEHKFTGNLTNDWVEQWRMDSQLSTYIAGAQENTGKNVLGAYLNAIELKKVSDSNRKCKDHGVPYEECGTQHSKSFLFGPIQRTPEELKEWRKTATGLAKKFWDLRKRFPAVADIHRVRTQGKFNGSCRWCGFKDFCQVGRPVDLAGQMLRVEKWKPVEYSLGEAKTTGSKP